MKLIKMVRWRRYVDARRKCVRLGRTAGAGLFVTDLHISASPRLTREIPELPPPSSTENKHPLWLPASFLLDLTRAAVGGAYRDVPSAVSLSQWLDGLHLVQYKSTFSPILNIYSNLHSNFLFLEDLTCFCWQNTNRNAYLHKLALPRVGERWKHFFILLHSELSDGQEEF